MKKVYYVYLPQIHTQMKKQVEEINELNCPICMCLFNTPVTMECGHTFCRFCLLNSVKTKKQCPMCRTVLTNFNERPKQDETVNSLIAYFKTKNRESLKAKSEQISMRKVQGLLLLDIKTSELLLPFTKVIATFELQSPTLLPKLDKFVARQEPPFNQFGVISKICTLHQLRFNVYQCTIEGKNMCRILQDWVQDKENEQDEDFFYRACDAEEISEYSELEIKNFDKFLFLFSHIKNTQILQYLYKQIDPHVFVEKNDSLALYYSIIRVMIGSAEEKYENVITFSDEKRLQFLNKKLVNINVRDVEKDAGILVDTQGFGSNYRVLFFFIVLSMLLAFLYFHSSILDQF